MIIELDDYSIVDALRHPFANEGMNIVVIPTNQQGIFGAGVAKIIRDGMPEVEKVVREAGVTKGLLIPSRLQTVLTNHPLITLALLPTKVSPWDKKSTIVSITQGLNMLFSNAEYGSIIIMPRIGTGHGGLEWESKSGDGIRSIVEKLAERNDQTVIVTNKHVIETTRGFGVGRAAYDFCVHGWGFGDKWAPEYYAMTHEGMEAMVEENLLRFVRTDENEDASAWTLLNNIGHIESGYEYRVRPNVLGLFENNRNSLSMSQLFWREAFTGYVRPATNRSYHLVTAGDTTSVSFPLDVLPERGDDD
jgi:O-acetyl-ADP-ribose deacetylase (regulator of RNase III)